MLFMTFLKNIQRPAMLNDAIPTLLRNKFENSNRNHSNPSQLYLARMASINFKQLAPLETTTQNLLSVICIQARFFFHFIVHIMLHL